MEGWIKLHRKLLDWEWYQDSKSVHLFVHILLNTNHKDKKHKGILVKSGQYKTGRKKLAEETGLSEQSIRTILDRLKSTNEITIKSTSKYSIITVVNWTSYQSEEKKPPNKNADTQPTSNQQVTTTKNDKNEKKENMLELFTEFYALYPRKEARGKAEPAYNKAIKEGATHEEIIGGLKAYNERIRKDGTERKYIALPASWLNAKRWQDRYEEVKKQAPKANMQAKDLRNEFNF